MKLIFSVILSIFAVGAMAQQVTVKGRVVGSDTGEGEVGAIVQFIDPDAAKAVAFTSADDEGYFSHNLKGGRQYKLLISNLGRKDVESSFSLGLETLNLGSFPMEDDASQLDAASITAQKVLVKMDVDKMTYNVSEDTDSKSSTVLDMLRKVPMVTVDAQDNITVNGSSSFLVTVDGKPNQMLSKNASTVFKMMPASAIKDIEVITNPGVKYDAEGVGGVLNLVTGAAAGSAGGSVTDGQYGSLSLTSGTSQNNIGGMFTMQRGKFSASLNASYGYQRLGDIHVLNETVTTSGYSKNAGTSSQRTPFAWGDLSLSYEPDTLNLISFSGGLMSYNLKQHAVMDMYSGLDRNTSELAYGSDSRSRSRSGNFNVGADWQHRFAGSADKVFTLSYRGGFNPGKSWSKGYFTPESAFLPSRLNDGRTTSDEHTVQADLTVPAGRTGKLSAGTKFTYRKSSSVQDLFLRTGEGGDFVLDPASAVDYTYGNKIGAAYLEYSVNVGKIGVKAGARYEYTWQDITYSKGAGQDYSARYGFLVPTASVQYSLAPTQNIGLSYNMRINRPGIGYLNPFVDTSDPSHVSFGNPDLDVAKNHNISLVYNFYCPVFMVSATLRHSRTGGGISDYTYNDKDVLFTTYGNIVKTQTSGLSIFGNVNLGRSTRVYANLSSDYSDMRSAVLGYKSGHWATNVYMGAQQTVFWDLRLSENLILSPRHYSLQGWNSGFRAAILSVSKSFLEDRLTVSVTGVSPLDGRYAKFRNVSSGGTYSMDNVVKVPIRQAMVSLSWKFGKVGSASVKKAARSIENDDVVDKSAQDATGGAAGSLTGGAGAR